MPLPEKVEMIKNAQVPKKHDRIKIIFGFYKLLSQTLTEFLVFPGTVTMFIKKRNSMEMD